MKLLIVAGPYEADRIRRAATSAGFEAVAVEPGESLSGWITATRPDVIILAPQIVSPDPTVALAKVRAVPRGRVPILLVGDAGDEELLAPLADGFFVRPIAPEDLVERARAATARAASGSGSATDAEGGSGPRPRAAAAPFASNGGTAVKAPTLKPLVAAQEPIASEPAPPPTREVPGGAVPVGPILEPPLRAGTMPPPPPRRLPTLFENLAETIDADMDADLDAEIRDVARAIGSARKSVSEAGGEPAADAQGDAEADAAVEALNELTDESSQKTLEVPQVVANAIAEDEVDLDLPALLARMYLSRLSGRLTLKRGKTKKYIAFERGHPVVAGSNRTADRLSEMLVRQGRLTAEQATTLGDEAAAAGQRLGALLVERGLLGADQLTGTVRRHYEEIIYSLFAWERGAWNLGTDNSVAAEKIMLSLHPAALIREGIRRRQDLGWILAALGGGTRVFRLHAGTGAVELLDKLGVDAEERRALRLFDGLRDLDEVRGGSGLAEPDLYSLVWTLFVLERLEPVEGGTADAFPADELAAELGPPPPPDDERNARDAAADRALVQARHALVVDGDYFQILDLSRGAGAEEIQRAHQALGADLAPAALHPVVAAELHGELEEIHLVLAEAARLLGDERVRQGYREHLAPAPGASRSGAES